ncbi:MAG: hypothetical protein MMC23_005910 [Stictis urceolatum]|nr:hypothetical protein [Stictis urceolata]
MQVIDVNTCEPVVGQYVEFWHCNSTGVYGGIVAGGKDNQADATNINKTFLPTDGEGVVQIASTFPGHYTGPTPHIDILTHGNGTDLPNKTFVGGTSSHDLISAVEANAPHSANTQPLATNAEDSITSQEAETTDPVLEYVYAGASVEEGMVMWVTVRVDSTVNETVQAATSYGEDGEHTSSNSGGGFSGDPSETGRPTGLPTASA